jgi:anti-sigma-K factor RskA
MLGKVSPDGRDSPDAHRGSGNYWRSIGVIVAAVTIGVLVVKNPGWAIGVSTAIAVISVGASKR